MANIQKLWTSYVDLGSDGNQTSGTTYIGQDGRLWYDPVTNSIRVSDGNTAGGTVVAGGSGGTVAGSNTQVQFNNNDSFGASSNFTYDGSNLKVGNLIFNNQTISGNVADSDITIQPVGDGNIQILGGFHIHTDGNASNAQQFSVVDSRVTMLVPNVSALNGSVNIVGSVDGTEVLPQNYGVMLHVTGQPSTPSRIYNDGVATYAAHIGRRYNGTSAAPTGVLANQIMSRHGATPFLSNGGWPAISTTRVDFVSTEIQTPSAQGSKVQIWTVDDGENTTTLTAEFQTEGIRLHGNLVPNITDTFSLGNAMLKWNSVHIGPSSLYIEDSTLGTDAELTVDNGQLVINGVQEVRVANMSLNANGISTSNTAQNIVIGNTADTGYTVIKNEGIEFRDGTQQTTAAIPLDQRGNALGVATLDSGGKVPTSQLPAGAVVYKGAWDASTNTPTLADGTGTAGDQYSVSVAGTVDFGAGPITFAVGDFVIYNGTIWSKIPTAIGVASFNTRTGAVTLTSLDVTTALSAGSLVNSKLANPNLTVTAGSGLSGGGLIALGGSATLTANVRDINGGTGVTVTPSTGNYQISIGQPVGTANSVQFAGITSSTTIQATGNLIGGNISTGGQVVATGNITTSLAFKTPNTTINSGVVTTGNISGGNLAITGIANVTGNITAGNVAATNYTGLVTHGVRNAGAVTGSLAIDVATDDIVKCTFSGDFTVSFTNITEGRVVTLIATNTSFGDSDVITAGVAALNTTSGGTFTVTQQTTAVVTYYSTGTTTANIFAAAVYA